MVIQSFRWPHEEKIPLVESMNSFEELKNEFEIHSFHATKEVNKLFIR